MDKPFPASSPKIYRVLSVTVKPHHKPCCQPIVSSHFPPKHFGHIKNIFLQSTYKLQEYQLHPLQLSPAAIPVLVLTAAYIYNHQKNWWDAVLVNIFNSPRSSHLNQKNKWDKMIWGVPTLHFWNIIQAVLAKTTALQENVIEKSVSVGYWKKRSRSNERSKPLSLRSHFMLFCFYWACFKN